MSACLTPCFRPFQAGASQDLQALKKNAADGGANQLELCGLIMQNFDVRLRCRMSLSAHVARTSAVLRPLQFGLPLSVFDLTGWTTSRHRFLLRTWPACALPRPVTVVPNSRQTDAICDGLHPNWGGCLPNFMMGRCCTVCRS